MNKKVKVAIIGAGTAGLSAFKEARKFTDEIVMIDPGPLGTTCARVGCMPSKLLIHVANQFHERHHFESIGIEGAESLRINRVAAMERVRALRDRFTSGVSDFVEALPAEQFLHARAEFLEPTVLKVGDVIIQAEKVIIASGSSNVEPSDWEIDPTRMLSSETVFEQKDFPDNMAVIGGGIIGLELGQALARLGVNVTLYHSGDMIGGISDPAVNDSAVAAISKEFDLKLNERVCVRQVGDQIIVTTSEGEQTHDAMLIAMGRKPNLSALGFDKLGIALDEQGLPDYNNMTMQLADLPIYIAGDANKERPLLHEAADEGRIAGYNAANASQQCFVRRTPIKIIFSQPNIISAGQTFAELAGQDIVIGEVSYADQGRARIENHHQGLLHIYGDKKTGRVLGAEGVAPDGEHLAHLLAWAVQKKLSVHDMLQLPFYHPVVEEGMRTALRDLAQKVRTSSADFELAICDSEAVAPLK